MSTATQPLTPLTPPSRLAPDDDELLFLWFTSDDALTAICRDHNMTLRQIAAWAKRPDIAETIATLRQLHEERAKLQLTLAAHDAILTLKFITTTEQPTNANEIARRAAEGILSRCHHLRPKGARVVVKPPPAPTPPTTPIPSAPTTATTEAPTQPSEAPSPIPRPIPPAIPRAIEVGSSGPTSMSLPSHPPHHAAPQGRPPPILVPLSERTQQ